MTRLLLVLLLLISPISVWAGSVFPDNAPAGLSSTIAASGTTAGGGVVIGGYPTVVVQLAGAWSSTGLGLIQFEVSNDNSFFFPQTCTSSSGSIASLTQTSSYSTIASGVYRCNTMGAMYFRLNALTWIDGKIASVVGRMVGSF